MRELFNNSDLGERKKRGELAERVEKQRHADPQRSGQPFCTYSQILLWLDPSNMNNEAARFHQYLQPDGSIGASGKPDPIRLELGGFVYKLRRQV